MQIGIPAFDGRSEAAQGLLGLAVALGIGLLIGAERERRKGRQSGGAAAGIRTFAIAALAGAASLQVGGLVVFSITTAVVGTLAAVSCWAARRSDDPGITTEVALVLTLLLGGLAIRDPRLAAMTGAATAILLAARTPLHRFVGSVLNELEVRDALILAGATLIILPLLPDRTFGPYGVVNPRAIWILVILVLSVGAAGHVAVRLTGVRFGLPVAGLLAGFVSSAAAVSAMGERARRNPAEQPAAAAAAVMSTVATMVQLALVLAATSEPTLRQAAPSLVAGGVVALGFGLLSVIHAIRRPTAVEARQQGAFSLEEADDNGAAPSIWTVEELDDGCFELTIPSAEPLAGIIDGQHRLDGFKNVTDPDRRNMELICSVFMALPKPFQAQLFATINSTQKQVDKSLTYELFGYNISDEPSDRWTPDKLAVFLTRRLNTQEESPLRGRIAVAPQRDKALEDLNAARNWHVSTATIVEGILRLISANPKRDTNAMLSPPVKPRRALREGPKDRTPLRDVYIQGQDALLYGIVLNFLKACDRLLWQPSPAAPTVVSGVGWRFVDMPKAMVGHQEFLDRARGHYLVLDHGQAGRGVEVQQPVAVIVQPRGGRRVDEAGHLPFDARAILGLDVFPVELSVDEEAGDDVGLAFEVIWVAVQEGIAVQVLR